MRRDREVGGREVEEPRSEDRIDREGLVVRGIWGERWECVKYFGILEIKLQ